MPGATEIVPSNGSSHNHLADPQEIEKKRRISAMKAFAAANMSTPSGSLAAEAQEGLSAEALQSMPTLRSLQHAVSNVRKVRLGTTADLPPDKFHLPNHLQQTIREKRFLLFDSRDADPGQPVILGFASEHGIGLLRENRTWCCDGTFYSAARYWDSLFVIHAMIHTSSVPGCFILLPDRRQSTYQRALKHFADSEACRGLKPTSIICDFELAMSSSMQAQFKDAELWYCYFHLAKNAWLHVQKKGLIVLYRMPEVRALLRAFPSLAFLPLNEVEEGFEDVSTALRSLIPSVIHPRYRTDVSRYIRYFGDTYVGKTVRGQYCRPRYEPETWNCHLRTLCGDARTNNSSEGANAALNAMFPKSAPVLSQFLLRIRKLEERTHNITVRHANNPGSTLKGRPPANVQREQNIRAAVEEYAGKHIGQRNRLSFLIRIQYHLSPKAFELLLDKEDAVLDRQSSSPTTTFRYATHAAVRNPPSPAKQATLRNPIRMRKATISQRVIAARRALIARRNAVATQIVAHLRDARSERGTTPIEAQSAAVPLSVVATERTSSTISTPEVDGKNQQGSPRKKLLLHVKRWAKHAPITTFICQQSHTSNPLL